jgi:hypothetical protein
MIPRRVEVDLGASAKAWAADRAARTCAAKLSGGFLIHFGGDIAISGPPPEGVAGRDRGPGARSPWGLSAGCPATGGGHSPDGWHLPSGRGRAGAEPSRW